MYTKILIHLLFVNVLISCVQSQNTNSTHKDESKPKYIWLDASGNFERFAHKDSILYYLDKVKETGFNRIVVDVRPNKGDVLYKSDFMTPLTELRGFVVERDWDYLQFFIDEAKKRT